MCARIIVTGLILDPETSLRDALFSPSGLSSTVERKMTRAASTLHRSVTKTAINVKGSWRTRQASKRSVPTKKESLLTEAPFQKAVAKQQSLSASGRPYLRHSWHRIDMIAVLAFWIMFALAVTGKEATAARHIYLFRALSVLRVGRLLVITSGTTTILHSLKRAVSAIDHRRVLSGVRSGLILHYWRAEFPRILQDGQCVLTDPTNSSNVIDLSQQCGGYLNATKLRNVPYVNLDGTAANVRSPGAIFALLDRSAG